MSTPAHHVYSPASDSRLVAPEGPLNVIIDSVDTLLSDMESVSEMIRLLSELLAVVRARGGKHLSINLATLCKLTPPLPQAPPA